MSKKIILLIAISTLLSLSMCAGRMLTYDEPNCHQYDKAGVCIKCSFTYYFNANRVCTRVGLGCSKWDQTNGKCSACFYGYKVQNGLCVTIGTVPVTNTDVNCKTVVNKICTECYLRWYVSSTSGLCTKVSDYCRTWNKTTGKCLSCYDDRFLQDGACALLGGNQGNNTDQNCKTVVNNKCTVCYLRWFVDSLTNVCTKVSDYCRTWDNNSGKCLTCYDDRQVKAGACVLRGGDRGNNTDVNCKTVVNNKCTVCYLRWFVDSATNICKKVSDYCRTWDNASGKCLTCYDDRFVQAGACVLLGGNNGNNDVNCKTVVNNKCTVCNLRWYVDSVTNVCKKVSDYCKTWDNNSGKCLTCYEGRFVQAGACVLLGSDHGTNTDVNCRTVVNNKCTVCNFRWFVDSVTNVCTKVSDQCKTWDNASGKCLSCYEGRFVQAGVCVLLGGDRGTNTDINCRTVVSNKCTQCNFRWFVDSVTNVCKKVSDYCKTWNNTTGKCLTCYGGYNLVAGSCNLA